MPPPSVADESFTTPIDVTAAGGSGFSNRRCERFRHRSEQYFAVWRFAENRP
jgi:hypothetical protein